MQKLTTCALVSKGKPSSVLRLSGTRGRVGTNTGSRTAEPIGTHIGFNTVESTGTEGRAGMLLGSRLCTCVAMPRQARTERVILLTECVACLTAGTRYAPAMTALKGSGLATAQAVAATARRQGLAQEMCEGGLRAPMDVGDRNLERRPQVSRERAGGGGG